MIGYLTIGYFVTEFFFVRGWLSAPELSSSTS